MVYDSTLPTIGTWTLGSVGSDSPLYLGGSVRREARATMQGQLDEIIIANRSMTFFDCKRVEEVAARGFCLSTISLVPIASTMILPLGAQSDYSVELLNRGPLAAPSFTAIHYPVATNQLVISTDVGSATIQDASIRWDIQGLQTGAHAAMSIRTTPNEPIDFRYFSFQFFNTANELRLGLEDGAIGPVRVFADADRDQIEDGWETANGLDPTSAIDAEADPDRDGVNNRDEYLAGTDPRLSSSRLELWISHRPDAITVLLPATSTEVYYYVESLENAAFTRWIIRGGSFGTGGPLQIQTTPAYNAGSEFFRIRAERMRN